MSTMEQTGTRTVIERAAAQANVEQKQYLTFMLGGELFAIGILAIKEIIEYGGLTEAPMMPTCIRGVINLRGAAVPIMDLSRRFERAPALIGKRTCIVIVEVEANARQQVIGVIVDAVNAVVEIASAEIEPPPSFGAKIDTDLIEGMGKIGKRFVIILNVHAVLSSNEKEAFGNARDDALMAELALAAE